MITSTIPNSALKVDIGSILLPQEISHYFPDAEEVSLLSGGDVNTCYRVKTAKETSVIRIGKPNLDNFGFDRDREYQFYLECERLGLAPTLKRIDVSNGILIMDYIDGQQVDNTLVRQLNLIPEIAKVLQTMHTVRCDEIREPITISYIRFQMEKLKALGYLPLGWEEAIQHTLEHTYISKELVLCHNDLAFNLLYEKGRLWVIDLECAGWNDPLFDLAPLCIWYDFSPEKKQQLLTAYFGELKMEKELDQAIRVVLIFSALWSQLEVAYGNPNYQEQAQSLFERACHSSIFGNVSPDPDL